MKKYQDMNAQVINQWVKEGWEWGVPISHETFLEAKNGHWGVVLTPHKIVPHEWFPPMNQANVLGLASGGGQQMPIFAALGANVTVLDYSSEQLKSEMLVSQREGYSIALVQADMTNPFPFSDESFDLIFHPVSNVYVESVESIFTECFRVLKPGGVLMCGLDNGINFIVDESEQRIVQSLPFNPLKNPQQKASYNTDEDGYQFSHSLDENIGSQLRAGFVLTAIYDDLNTSGHLKDLNIPSYYATRSIKPTR